MTESSETQKHNLHNPKINSDEKKINELAAADQITKKDNSHMARLIDLKDVIAITAIIIIGLFFATLPFKDNPMPFGEADGAHQFGTSNYFSSIDRVYIHSPYFIYTTWYTSPNVWTGDSFSGALYPPFYFINGALFQSLTGERFTGFHIFVVITSILLTAIGVYFLIRKLFGFYPALFSGIMMLFSYRSIMGYIWGQRAILAAVAFIPIIIYSYYKYTESYLEHKAIADRANNISAGEEKTIYLWLMTLFLLMTALTHAMMFVFSGIVIGVYTLALIIKNKKIPFNYKHVIIAVLAFIIIFFPFGYQLSKSTVGRSNPFEIKNIGTLFLWYDSSGQDNPQLYEYDKAYGGYWTLPLLFIGLLYIGLRAFTKKDNKAILLLCIILSLYIIFHLPVINQTQYRMDRLIKLEALFFIPLIALSTIFISSFFKNKITKDYVQIGLIIVLLLIALFTIIIPFVSIYKAPQYDGIGRLTQSELELSEWLKKNTAPQDITLLMGTITYPKEKYINVLAERSVKNTYFGLDEPERFIGRLKSTEELVSNFTKGNVTRVKFAVFDYSDLRYLTQDQRFARFFPAMEEFRIAYISNESIPLYQKDGIFVFYLDNSPIQSN